MTGEPRDLASLRAALTAGWRPKFQFFWSHETRAARIGAECFSQWYLAPFEVEGRRFETAEHYMMHAKALLFHDEEIAERILEVTHPGEAKKLGRLVENFDGAVWERRREDIVLAGNLAKFRAHPELREVLLRTGERLLVEASPVDRIWGIGLAADDPLAEHPLGWRGLNLLGFALMRVRATLREQG